MSQAAGHGKGKSLLQKVQYKTREELEKENPSLQAYGLKSGLHLEAIKKLQSIGARLIQVVGQMLKYPIDTITTAVFYYHRFYQQHQFQAHDRLQVATACLFLAGKVEESPRALKMVIHVMYSHRFKKFPSLRRKIMEDSTTYELVKERVLVVERSLLYTVGFDFNVEKPYKHIVQLKSIVDDYFSHKFSGRSEIVPDSKKVLQTAWNFAVDSLRLNVQLQFPAHHIAVVCFYLAMKLMLKDSAAMQEVCKDGTEFYKVWTDMMNHVKPDHSNPAEVREKRRKFLMPHESIHQLLTQITGLYEHVTVAVTKEEGEIDDDSDGQAKGQQNGSNKRSLDEADAKDSDRPKGENGTHPEQKKQKVDDKP